MTRLYDMEFLCGEPFRQRRANLLVSLVGSAQVVRIPTNLGLTASCVQRNGRHSTGPFSPTFAFPPALVAESFSLTTA